MSQVLFIFNFQGCRTYCFKQNSSLDFEFINQTENNGLNNSFERKFVESFIQKDHLD